MEMKNKLEMRLRINEEMKKNVREVME